MASKATKRKVRRGPIAEATDDLTDGLDAEAEPLALHIDRDLDTRVWNGTSFADRTVHADAMLHRDMVTQVERSLMAQENYDQFEARWLKQLGLSTEEPAGALRDLETRLLNETRVAWNEAMVSANADQPDTILVWRSRLMPTTTPGCAARHGLSIDGELNGDVPPRHFNCYCDALTLANPDSDDPDTAAAGRALLDEMAAERADWGASDADLMTESLHDGGGPQ